VHPWSKSFAKILRRGQVADVVDLDRPSASKWHLVLTLAFTALTKGIRRESGRNTADTATMAVALVALVALVDDGMGANG
jgi:hypothetical protein